MNTQSVDAHPNFAAASQAILTPANVAMLAECAISVAGCNKEPQADDIADATATLAGTALGGITLAASSVAILAATQPLVAYRIAQTMEDAVKALKDLLDPAAEYPDGSFSVPVTGN